MNIITSFPATRKIFGISRLLKPTILSSSKSWLICTRIANNAEQRGIAALLYNVLFKYHLMIPKVDFLRGRIYTVFIG